MNMSIMYKLIIFILLLALGLGCQSNPKLITGEGFVEVTGGKIWYRIVGEGDNTPLLLLHGGPGAPSYYLNPLVDLGKERPVIFFDQLGSGRSDRDIDTSLMTIESYVEQLEELRITLGLEEFYLYGHSWGTMLGMDYYLKYPEGIKAMIFSSPVLSVSRWTKDTDTLLATLPDSIQNTITTNVANGSYESSEYQQAMTIYNEKFFARKIPWSANIDSTFTQMNFELYQYMWGPNDFTATGNLKNYERTSQLKEIEVPTLFITGEFDQVRPSTVNYYQSLVVNSKFAMIDDAAHFTMHDNPKRHNQVINDFLTNIEED